MGGDSAGSAKPFTLTRAFTAHVGIRHDRVDRKVCSCERHEFCDVAEEQGDMQSHITRSCAHVNTQARKILGSTGFIKAKDVAPPKRETNSL